MILRIGGIPDQTTETLKYISFFVVGILLAQYFCTANPGAPTSNAKDFTDSQELLLCLLSYSLAHLLPGAAKDTLILIGASGFIVAGA